MHTATYIVIKVALTIHNYAFPLPPLPKGRSLSDSGTPFRYTCNNRLAINAMPVHEGGSEE